MLKNEKFVSYEDALGLWNVDVESGVVSWKFKRNSAIPDDLSSNTRDKHGYKMLNLDKRRYYHHRIIWLFKNKEWPENFIDHINGIPWDNRIENLRNATSYENQQNRKKKVNRKINSMGVYFNKDRNKFVPQIRVNGKGVYLGRYDTEAEAAKVYLEAKLNYHPYSIKERCK